MKTNHTPGPWTVTDCASHIQIHREGWPRDAWSVACIGHQAQDIANARLISAAPELLEALQELLRDPYLSDPINSDRMAKSRLAVAKATGENAKP